MRQRTLGALRGPHNEVEATMNLLIDQYDYDPKDIVILKDSAGQSDDFLPTRDNIIKRIEELVADARNGDHFYFHFSGHSAQIPTTDTAEEDRMNECILTCDGYYILDDDLRRDLVDPIPNEAYLTICLSSAGDGQKSWEDEKGASMTSALIEMLQNNPRPTREDVLTTVSFTLHQQSINLHIQARSYRKEVQQLNLLRRSFGKLAKKGHTVEMNNFQNPQLSSHEPMEAAEAANRAPSAKDREKDASANMILHSAKHRVWNLCITTASTLAITNTGQQDALSPGDRRQMGVSDNYIYAFILPGSLAFPCHLLQALVMDLTLRPNAYADYFLVHLNVLPLLKCISQWALRISETSKRDLPAIVAGPMASVARYEPKRRALLIGIVGKGEGILKGPHEDVKEMSVFLQEKYQYSPKNVTCLLDAPGYEQPTRENILKHIALLVADAKPRDHFFFHYSGHSNQENTADTREEDGMNEFLDISENEKILDDELRELMVDKLPPGASLTAVFDSCHSGTLLDLPHYHCNAVYLPFVNKGTRGTKDNWRLLNRENAGLYPNTPNTPSPRTPRSQRLGLRRFSILNDARANRAVQQQLPQVLPEVQGSNPAPSAVEPTRSLSIDTAIDATHIAQLCPSAMMYESPDQTFQCNGFILHARAIELHAAAADFRSKMRVYNEKRVKKGKQPIRLDTMPPPEMINFQIPQLSSERPLPRDQLWDP
ncbi:hypothetical protein NLJ89_g5897 [Agrocybe chaxingu]|uniref:Peptidase C14 caspase domain-containing protein n=1 Tax=Agrocybe chaxingu TaxID=84603 RepID=A0A9W8JXJ8_9AGAR|nr:hypothetical protein NLJ89_g5897 [Agrocybe chaxingu]